MNAKDRRKALDRAKMAKRPLSRIASEIGVNEASLRTAVMRNSPNSPIIRSLDDWLEQNGYSLDSPVSAPVVRRPGPTTAHLIAQDLRSLADFMDSSDYPEDMKAKKFAAWIAFNFHNLQDVCRTVFAGFDAPDSDS